MKNALLLSTALIAFTNQATAQTLYRTEDPSTQTSHSSLGAITLGALLVGGAIAMGAGGGGDDSSGKDTPPPDDGDGPTPAPKAPRESFDTLEYRRNWGLDHINVDARYAEGGTGLGALAAVFDSGVDVTHPDLDSKIAYTYSYYGLDGDVTDESGHGTHVSGIIAAEKNDIGTHGVAFDAELAVFQGLDHSGTPAMTITNAWADANYQAADLGASAINHSWTFVNEFGETRTIDEFSSRAELESYFGRAVMASLDYAANHNMISVFAAGNSGKDEVSNQAGMAVYFPEYSDYVLGVVAIDQNDQIADFSNRCGMAADFCLAAPGTGILSTIPGNQYAYADGTSMAAPHVTGAITVLASNFPELTGAEITRILKDTARDLGAPGVDEIYGHGALDLENAMAPQGSMVFQSSGTLGEKTYMVEDSHISASGGLDRALKTTLSRQKIIVTDRYDRAYATQMDDFVGSGADIHRDKSMMMGYALGKADTARVSSEASTLSFSFSGLSALAEPGQIDPALTAPYAALLHDAGGMRYSTDIGFAEISFSGAASAYGDHAPGSYYSAEARTKLGKHGLTLGLGHLSEKSAFLGTDVSGAFGEHLDAHTDFLSIKGDFSLADRYSLLLSGAFGQSDFSGSGMLKSGKDIATRSFGIGITSRDTLFSGDRLQIAMVQPMSVSGGTMAISVPTGLGAAVDGQRSDEVEMSSTRIDMEHSTAPVDLKIGYEIEALGGRIALGAAMRNGDSRHKVGSLGYTLRF